MNVTFPREYLRLAAVIHALWDDWRQNGGDWWCDTRLFDFLVPDKYTVIGYSIASNATGVRKRREHIVPRLAIAERCFKMFDEHRSIEEVGGFLSEFLRIVVVTDEEARRIDSLALAQKEKMPVCDWWTKPDDRFARLKRAGVEYRLKDLPS